MLADYNYQDHLETPEIIAERIISQLEVEGKLSFPLDPFYILNRLNVSYKLLDFEDLEGIYIVPNDNTDRAIVGINKNRPIKRQRFTAAHEICHHIKDKEEQMILCPIDGRKNEIERFADKFAAELLMPKKYLKAEAKKYLKEGYVGFDDALRISVYFGVSFQACVFALAYDLKYIDGEIDSNNLKRRIKDYKPSKKIKELMINERILDLKYQLIDYYEFVDPVNEDFYWYKFTNNYISNEERLEGSKLDESSINTIITDLRLKKQNSEFCSSEYQSIIETAGQVEMFNFIFQKKTIDEESMPLRELHKRLYKYSPYSEYSGEFRNTNNVVLKSNLETCDYNLIYQEIYQINKEIYHIVDKMKFMKNSEFISQVTILHHKITAVHPFVDGNGRVARALVNWLFYMKGLYPIYIKVTKKDEYLSALEKSDKENNFNDLIELFINEIIESDILLNDRELRINS